MDLSEKEKRELAKQFPNLKKHQKKLDKENSHKKYRLRIVDVNRIDFLEKLAARTEGYLTQITQSFKTLKSNEDSIKKLTNKFDEVVDMLKEKEHQRRKTAGKVGGLTASLNKEKEKTEELIKNKASLENTIEELKDEVETKELELKEKDLKIEIYKNLGKKRQMEDYKKIQEIRKDIDRHKKIRGVNYE